MPFTTTQKTLLAINILIVLGFGYHYLQEFNYEFVAYAVTIAVIVSVLFGSLHITRFPTYIIAGVTLWAFMHMMGGSVQTPDGVLYAWRMLPVFDGGGEFYILKFDQFVHAFLYGVVALMFYHLLREVVGIGTHERFIAFISIFAAAGVGIMNEIIEFSAVVALPETGVGGYHNTVLDLIFNLTGALLAILVYRFYGRSRLFQGTQARDRA